MTYRNWCIGLLIGLLCVLVSCSESSPPSCPAGTGGTGAGAGGSGPGGEGGSVSTGGTGGTGGSISIGGGHPLPALPLRTEGRWIVAADGARFKLASVSWYGAEEMDYVPAGLEIAHRYDIARQVRDLGFNSVRLPWSNELVAQNPIVANHVVLANPDLFGKRALEVLDAVVESLAHQGLVVVLDNHTSDADWCCSDHDGNGLWYTPKYPEQTWIQHWELLATRYLTTPAVVGADLRNEPRPVLEPSCTTCTTCPCASCSCVSPTWGTGDATDWQRAAQLAGNAILDINPDLLIVVQGLAYSSDFSGPYTSPIQLEVPNRLVYSPHDYSWFHPNLTTYDDLKTDLGNLWGYLLVQGQPYTAPVYVGELGTCHTSDTCVDDATGQGFWFSGIRTYLAEADIDWAYWALNGTQARGTGRTFGDEETYGVLDTSWSAPASTTLLTALQALQPATQGP